jgi:LysM repeat protein
VQTARPATYTLKEGEFVYCLARRFDVDPDQILALNGLVDSETIYPGTTLKIPSTGSFPGTRALRAHPATYIVKADETVYSIACLYGDVDPLNIAAVNGLSAPFTVTVGAQIQIP